MPKHLAVISGEIRELAPGDTAPSGGSRQCTLLSARVHNGVRGQKTVASIAAVDTAGKADTTRMDESMDESSETVRIEAFSDGVFGIAMTLLVIQIKVPSHELVAANGLVHSLAALWPSYLAFVTSFVTVLVIWAHHHWMFVLINKNDHAFLYWNGLLLLFVTFVPFPTALLAEYLLHPEARVAANLYTGTFLAISLAFAALWRHASLRLLSTNPTGKKRDEALQIGRQYRLGPPLYLGTFGVSFLSEAWSVALCLLVALFFAIQNWRTAGSSKVTDRSEI